MDDSNERAKFADPRQYRKSGWIIRREDDVAFPCAQQRNAGNMRGMRKLLILKEKGRERKRKREKEKEREREREREREEWLALVSTKKNQCSPTKW